MTATIKAVKSADYYFAKITHKYLTEGGNAPGKWLGSAASALGLGKIVEKLPFQRILAGLHPTAEKSLVQVQRDANDEAVLHRPGFDVVFKPPKSVSIDWAISGIVKRKRLEREFDLSIKDTIAWAEENVPLTRRGKGGHHRERAKLVIAAFDHVSNRNGEPLLHRHNVFCNVCQREDGTWGTLDSKTLHAWIRTLGPIFRANLASRLRKLGVELEDATDAEGKQEGWFEVKGVPKNLIKAMSTRRAEILEAIEGEGGSLGQSSHKALTKAARETRKAKETCLPREQMHEQWREQAAKFGYTMRDAEAISRKPPLTQGRDSFHVAWTAAIEKITKTEASFTERRLIQEVCERLQVGQFSGVEIANRVKQELTQSQEIVQLRNKGADQQFTTKEIWNLESELNGRVKTLQARSGLQVSGKTVDKVIAKHRSLDAEQAEAARQLLTASSAVRTMSGVAGAGKSTTLKVVKEAFESDGYRVIGAALSGIAKVELTQKTGMTARTIESYVHHFEKSDAERKLESLNHVRKQIGRSIAGQSTWERDVPYLNSKTVIVVDESSMLGTRQLNTLIKHVEKAGATIVLVGDRKQLQPIEAGMPVRHIEATSPHVHLTKNFRQLDERDRQAVQAIREGNAKEAIENYAARGLVTVAKNRREAISQIVSVWKADGGLKHPEKVAIYTPTRSEASVVNRSCQEARLAAAKTPHIVYASNGKERFYRGDRVLFHAPHRLYGGIENGFRGTVLTVDPFRAEVRVRLDQRPTTVKANHSPSNVVTIPLKQFGEDISLGYACTTHKGQSQTVERALLLMGGKNFDRELAYVQATRAKLQTKLFIDKAHAGEQLKDLIEAISKSNPKQNAHDQQRRQSISPQLRQEREP